MQSARFIAQALADAFNRRDLAAMVNALDERATAQVLGSGWAEESGRAQIAATSFPYLLRQGDHPLLAEAALLGEEVLVLLRRSADRSLELVARLRETDGRIVRIEYLVADFSRMDLERIAGALGIALCAGG